MGKFGNKGFDGAPDGPMYVGPRPKDHPENNGGYEHGRSEFDALGWPVPPWRKSSAIWHMKDMGFTDRAQMEAIVGRMAECVERDDSHEALEAGLRMGVDATGCYRLLAALLTGDKPEGYGERRVS